MAYLRRIVILGATLPEKDGRTKYYMGLNGRGRIGFLFLLVGMRRTTAPWLHSNNLMARY